MPPLPSLHELLTSASWHHLFAVAKTHGLRVSNRWRKADLVARLAEHLAHPDTLRCTVPQLPPSVQAALRALLAADGSLPLAAFTRRFGALTAYQPWREKPHARPPWLAPATPADHLYYRGVLFPWPARPNSGARAAACVPRELLPLLRSCFSATAAGELLGVAVPRPGLPPDLLWHLAILLATLAAATRPLVAQRWLSPTLLATLAARLGLDQDPAFQLRRSERAMPYVAFLHALLERGHLVTPGERVRLTPLAWQWLAAPPAPRYQQIWRALLACDPATALAYRFPWAYLSPQGWSLLTQRLARLTVGEPYPLAALLTDLALHERNGSLGLAADDERLRQLFCGPLHWLGILELEQAGAPLPDGPPAPAELPSFHLGEMNDLGEMDDLTPRAARLPTDGLPTAALTVRLTPLGGWLLAIPGWGMPAFPAAQPAWIGAREPDTLLLEPASAPVHLVRLAPTCRWDAPTWPHTAQRLTLDGPRMTQAIAAGMSLAQILHDLEQALGRPASHRQRRQLKAWADAAQQVTLRAATLLETDSAPRMGLLRSRRHLRPLLGRALSPTVSEVNPAHLDALRRSLAALGLSLAETPGAAGDGESVAQPADAASLLLTAALVLNGLGAHVPLPIRLPAELMEALGRANPAAQNEAAHLHAQAILADVAAALAGYLRLPPRQHAPEEERIMARLQEALAAQAEITIVYWAADQEQPTQRRITPYYFETRGRVRYLRAWCHLRQDERVFRVDRIARIVT